MKKITKKELNKLFTKKNREKAVKAIEELLIKIKTGKVSL